MVGLSLYQEGVTVIANIIELTKYYLFGLPYCIGMVVWYTVTLRPIQGLFSAALYSMSQFFKHVALYEGEESQPVVHMFNREEELIKSMKSYVEENSGEDTGEE